MEWEGSTMLPLPSLMSAGSDGLEAGEAGVEGLTLPLGVQVTHGALQVLGGVLLLPLAEEELDGLDGARCERGLRLLFPLDDPLTDLVGELDDLLEGRGDVCLSPL